DQLSEWLPREKLYALPRSLQTQGSRALGRLAFADNHLRLVTRLRRELEQVTHADAMYQSVTQTGMALRDGRPRIYVIAAARGGPGGGGPPGQLPLPRIDHAAGPAAGAHAARAGGRGRHDLPQLRHLRGLVPARPAAVAGGPAGVRPAAPGLAGQRRGDGPGR